MYKSMSMQSKRNIFLSTCPSHKQVVVNLAKTQEMLSKKFCSKLKNNQEFNDNKSHYIAL